MASSEVNMSQPDDMTAMFYCLEYARAKLIHLGETAPQFRSKKALRVVPSAINTIARIRGSLASLLIVKQPRVPKAIKNAEIVSTESRMVSRRNAILITPPTKRPSRRPRRASKTVQDTPTRLNGIYFIDKMGNQVPLRRSARIAELLTSANGSKTNY